VEIETTVPPRHEKRSTVLYYYRQLFKFPVLQKVPNLHIQTLPDEMGKVYCINSSLEGSSDSLMFIPDHRIRKTTSLFTKTKKWNSYLNQGC